MGDKWIFIIDTDDYAGNFERDMCAYVTGCTGDCEVGDEFAVIYLEDTKEEESKFHNYIEQRGDDNGCCRPTSIWLSKNKKYNSVAIFFEKKPTNKMIELMKERAGKFAEVKRGILENSWDKNFKLTIHGYRLMKETTTTEEETC